MIFSHGLGGSRNAYSHLLGSLSSHGVVVIAPDHRDGSSPVSFVQNVDKPGVSKVDYRKVPHNASTEVYESRDEQLRIRLRELGLVYDALVKVDQGQELTNLLEKQATKYDRKPTLSMFANQLDIHKPGSISFAGHSFGAATVVQFVKSVFYQSDSHEPGYKPLYAPARSARITTQITAATPVFLLDLWTLPIQSPATAWLREKPMPCYTSSSGGHNLLAILSEAFYKWNTNLQETKRIVAPPKNFSHNPSGPHVFYPASSAHLSQSDFGVLFPWVTTKIFGAKEPERMLKLNVRAMLQVLRDCHVEVANTSRADMELDMDPTAPADVGLDESILSKRDGVVKDWIAVPMDTDPFVKGPAADKAPADAVLEGEVLGEIVSKSERK